MNSDISVPTVQAHDPEGTLYIQIIASQKLFSLIKDIGILVVVNIMQGYISIFTYGQDWRLGLYDSYYVSILNGT